MRKGLAPALLFVSPLPPWKGPKFTFSPVCVCGGGRIVNIHFSLKLRREGGGGVEEGGGGGGEEGGVFVVVVRLFVCLKSWNVF